MSQINAVKINYNGTIRRVGRQYFTELEWVPFCQKLRELFRDEMPGLEDGTTRVAYKDCDGDQVTVASKPELEEAFSGPAPVLQIAISSSQSNSLSSLVSRATAVVANKAEAEREAAVKMLNDTVVNLRETDLDLGRSFSQLVTEICPTEVLLLYNASCIESLKGNVEEAAKYLKRAIQNGFKDIEHFVSDPDMTNVRNSPVRRELEQMMKAAATGAHTCKSFLKTVKDEAWTVTSQLQKEIATLFPQPTVVSASPTPPVETLPAETKPVETETPCPPTPVIPPLKVVTQPEQTGPGADIEILSVSSDSSNESVVEEIVVVNTPATPSADPEPEPEAQPEPQPQPVTGQYAAEVNQLKDMGFAQDVEALREVLVSTSGDVAHAIARLLQG